MKKQVLLSILALAAMIYLPQGVKADNVITSRDANNHLASILFYGIATTNHVYGGAISDVSFNGTSATSHAGPANTLMVKNADGYLKLTLTSALAEGDVITINGASAVDYSGSNGLYIYGNSEEASKIEYLMESGYKANTLIDITYTVTGSDVLYGKSELWVSRKANSIYIRSITIARSGVDDCMPETLSGSKTWNYATISSSTTGDVKADGACIVSDNMFYGDNSSSEATMKIAKKGDYYGLNLGTSGGTFPKALASASNAQNIVFIVPAGSGTVTVQNYQMEKGNVTVSYQVGTGTKTNLITSYVDALQSYSFTYSVKSPTPIWIGASAGSGKTCFVSLDVNHVSPNSITLNTIDYATFSSPLALDFTSTGCEAYIVTASDGGSLSYEQVYQVPAETGLLIKGTAGETYTPTVIASAESIGTNLLKPTLTATTVGDTGAEYGNVWVLGNLNSTPGFYKSNDGRTLSVGKAYLYLTGDQIPTAAAARDFFPFDFDDNGTTGVADVRSKMEDVRGEYFDLQGRRVAQPTRGLYIVNGKKVVIK